MAMGQLVRQLWTGVAAATVAGLLSAVITRLLMRAVAHLVNGIPQFSLGGSALIALVYIVSLLPCYPAALLSPTLAHAGRGSFFRAVVPS
jgi:hypothetical protein